MTPYAEQLKSVIRVQLTQPALRRQMDSLDICQSVFADFFIRAALGQYDLRSGDDLRRLLARMARHRLINHGQKQRAVRRDIRRLEPTPIEDFEVAGRDATPSQIVVARELLEQLQSRMSEEERSLVERRRSGQGWQEMADAIGKSPGALRKQYERAIQRVSDELGFSPSAD